MLFDDIEAGAEFYFSEDDYLSSQESIGKRRRSRIRINSRTERTIKTESSPGPSSDFQASPISTVISSEGSVRSCHRPRRGASSSTKNYAVPDSDDEMIVDANEDDIMHEVHALSRKRKAESNLQKWIKHLSVILKEEQKKV